MPEDFAFVGSGYLPVCDGFTPPKGIYSHISGIDLVQGKDGGWFILEDNLRIPGCWTILWRFAARAKKK